MKKRLLSLLCVLALCLSLLPATALAEDTLIATVETNSGTTSYYVGTGTDRQNNVYCETEVEAFQAAWAACGGQTATLTLKQSVELSAPLNSISSSSTQLTLCMEDGVTLTFTASDSNARISWEGGSLTFKSGTIQLNASAGSNSCAAIDCSGGTFALSGGTISCTVNSSSDSVYGVRVRSNGSFNMTGGSIVTNEQAGDIDGVYITSGGEAEISGGTISGNGCGVYVSGSNSSVTISDSAFISSSGTQSAVYLQQSASATITGGTITGSGSADGLRLLNGIANIDGNANISCGSGSNNCAISIDKTQSGSTVNISGNAQVSNSSSGYGIYVRSSSSTVNIQENVQVTSSSGTGIL